MFLENENRSFGWLKQKELPTKISYVSKGTIPFKPNQHQSSTYKRISCQHFPPHAYLSKAIFLSFFTMSLPIKENEKGVPPKGDTPYYYWKIDDFTFLSRPLSQVFLTKQQASNRSPIYIIGLDWFYSTQR